MWTTLILFRVIAKSLLSTIFLFILVLVFKATKSSRNRNATDVSNWAKKTRRWNVLSRQRYLIYLGIRQGGEFGCIWRTHRSCTFPWRNQIQSRNELIFFAELWTKLKNSQEYWIRLLGIILSQCCYTPTHILGRAGIIKLVWRHTSVL